MTDPTLESQGVIPDSNRQIYSTAGLIAVAAVIAYGNSFSAPFIFDDTASIVENPTIRSLWPLGSVLAPPQAAGATVGGRPLLNLSFALNYAIGGTHVWSYHTLNLLIHTLAGLTLFGIVRRALAATAFAAHALPLAGWTALLWTVHPVQTESVTYVVQRAESLNGLLYLLTLYAFIRGTAPAPARGWLTGSVVACLLGMATKEVMATAPVLVLLYDRAFVSGTFRNALRRHSAYYAALGSTWLLLGALIIGNGTRGGTAGFDVGVTSWDYAATQLRAVTHYLWISVHPYPLMIDHGGILSFDSIAAAVPFALPVLALIAGTALALSRWPRGGFLGAWFLLILAPSSSFVPLLDSIFEHRVYLSLAAPLLAIVLASGAALGSRAWLFLTTAAIALGGLTLNRNATYRSEAALWSENIAHKPGNARAWFMLGNVLLANGQLPDAIERYRTAIRLNRDYIEARNNLGSALLRAGRYDESLTELEAALRLRPLATTHFAAAVALTRLGRREEAIGHYNAALALRPDDAAALNNRGNLRLDAGETDAALADYLAALRIEPDHVDAHTNATIALLALGRLPEALTHGEAAVRLQPNYAAAHWKTGDALMALGRMPEAIDRYRDAVRLDPTLAQAQHNLARALTQSGRLTEALTAYERTLQLAPEWPAARYNTALVLEALGHLEPAVAQLQVALKLQPNFPEATNRLAQLQKRLPASRSAETVKP